MKHAEMNREKDLYYFASNTRFANPKEFSPEAIENNYAAQLEEFDSDGAYLHNFIAPTRKPVPKLGDTYLYLLDKEAIRSALHAEYKGLYDLMNESLENFAADKRRKEQSSLYGIVLRPAEDVLSELFAELTEIQKSLFRVHFCTSQKDANIERYFNSICYVRNYITYSRFIGIIGEYNYASDIIKLQDTYKFYGEFIFYMDVYFALYMFYTHNVKFYDMRGDSRRGFLDDRKCNVKPEDEIILFHHAKRKAMDLFMQLLDAFHYIG